MKHCTNSCSHPLFHTLDNEAQVFTHLLFAQVLLFTALREGQVGEFRIKGSNMTLWPRCSNLQTGVYLIK